MEEEDVQMAPDVVLDDVLEGVRSQSPNGEGAVSSRKAPVR
jgi:hypothetical protein